MPYIGRDLNRGNYLKLDDISSSFNSSTTTFNLTVGGSAFTPGSAFAILVSVGGVIQEPESAYQVNNSEITFANAPTAQDSFFCIALGVALGIGVPGNGTVNGTQMAKPFNYDGYFYLDDANNRVGIGSLQPKQALDIIGNTNISGILTATEFSGPLNNASGISTFYDLRVSNNLTVEGTTTTLDTNLIGVDRVEVGANSNTLAGIAVTQSGTADLVRLYDGTLQVVTVDDEGNVGIGTNNLDSTLDVVSLNTPTGITARTISTQNTNINKAIRVRNNSATETFNISYRGQGYFADNVGIGVTDPDSIFETVSSSTDGINAHIGGLYNDGGQSAVRRIEFGVKNYRNAIQSQQGSGGNNFSSNLDLLLNPSGGSVGIGTANPDDPLHIYHATDNFIGRFESGDAGSGIVLQDSTHTTSIVSNNGDFTINVDNGGDVTSETIKFEMSGSERLRITSSGKATFTTPGGDDALLIKGDNYTSVRVQSARDSDSDHAMFQMLGSRGTNASPTIVQSGDTLGTLSARGYDGNSYASSSNINFEVDGTPGDGDMPGRITFSTAADGSESPTEQVRIDSGGRLLIGTVTTKSAGSGQYAKLNVEGYAGGSECFASFSRAEAASAMSINDEVANLTFNDSAGYEFARIQVLADADTGTTDTPGRIVFRTTADGASSSTERLRIDSSGHLKHTGIRSGNSQNKLAILSAPSYNTSEEDVIIYQVENESGFNQLSIGGGTGSLNAATTLRFLTASAVNTTGGDERLRIDTNGRILIGTSSSRVTRSGGSGYHGLLQMESEIEAALTMTRFGGTHPSRLNLQHARGTIASIAAAQNDDDLGQITFSGWDGDTFTNAVEIIAEVDGAPGDDDMPGRLIFKTTPDNSSTPQERLRIASDGNVTLGNASYGSSLGQLRIINDASSAPASLALFGHNNTNDGDAFAQIQFAEQETGTAGQIKAKIEAQAVSTNERGADLVFFTAANSASSTPTERVRILSDGDVGIGTETVHNNARLQVSTHQQVVAMFEGTGVSDPQIYVGDNMSSPTDNCIILGYDKADNRGYLTVGGDGDDVFTVTNGGNIGINNNSPQRRLHIGQSGTAEANIRIQGGADTFELRVKDSDNCFSGHINIGGAGSLNLFNMYQSREIRFPGYVVAQTMGSGTTANTASFGATQSGMDANTYNFILSGSNDTGNKCTMFVNGSTRTADGGTNNLTFRNDGGDLILGSTSYLTHLPGLTEGTIRARTLVTSYQDSISNVGGCLTGGANDKDAWIFNWYDSASWGIYSRNIDSTLTVNGFGLPQNSTAFIGNATLKAYVSHESGVVCATGGFLIDGESTTTNQAKGITWSSYDKEGTADRSDVAGIIHTINQHGLAGSVLRIYSDNDDTDGIVLEGGNSTGAYGTRVVNGLEIRSGGLRPTAGTGENGIMWPTDPYGGTGDKAHIQYHNDGSGENTQLRIQCENDGDDDILITAPTVTITGSFIKPGGSFRIPHVLAGLTTTTDLVHSFIEGPQADNLYRGRTTLVAGISTVNIDTTNNMTEGTFVNLNRDVQCFTSNETGWTAVKGSVTGNLLTIVAQDNTCTDTISWMVVGERWDLHMYDPRNPMTDENGKVRTEVPNKNYNKGGGFEENYINENKLRVGISTISRPSIENKEVE